jgi:hypothetical protein
LLAGNRVATSRWIYSGSRAGTSFLLGNPLAVTCHGNSRCEASPSRFTIFVASEADSPDQHAIGPTRSLVRNKLKTAIRSKPAGRNVPQTHLGHFQNLSI